MLKTLMAEIKEYKKYTLLAPALVALEVFMEILIPFLMSKIVDMGVSAGNLKMVVIIGSVMIAAAVLSLIGGAMSGHFAAIASTGFAKNLRKAMFNNIQHYSFSNLDKYSTSGLITRLTTDVTNVQNSYQMIIRICVRAPLMLVCAFIMTIIIKPTISLIYLAAIIFLACVLYFIMTRAHVYFKQMFKRYDDLNASTQENISGIRTVKAYVREEYETKKFNIAAENVYNMSVKAENLIVANMPVMQFAVYTCILLVSWVGAKMIVSDTLTTGQLMSLFTYTMNILTSLMMISMVFTMVAMSKASGERIAEVINERTDLAAPLDSVKEVKDGSIEFKDVSFAYKKGGNNCLTNINISIKSGETIGIIGGTGSSKSTLVQLIPRLYDATEGEVSVGGLNVKNYELDALRSKVAMVLQKNVLFSGTVKDNLRWGNKDATDEEIKRACEYAQADEFVSAMPDGYDTWIEQGGSNVSGGQKQRLCIARALLMKPKILILDDSTSAVDTKTDAMIRKAFREQIPDTTKLIIAQRITSVQDADRILVLEGGEVNGFGTHEELLRTNGIYREVYESQLKGEDDE
ncbi:MAG: ABC transporter ATP-binding protein/permease [Clostridiales bacterium]|nr:ABC transporter ATP-binding protein/permease [Clostridiales bacterium]